MELLGFWSYVHDDNEAMMGRIAELGRDIVRNYESIRAEKIELFLDSDAIHWGDAWRDRINESLSNVAFFIPVISPRYFDSKECRREFQFFEERAKNMGIRELILPILWIDVPKLHEDEPADSIMRKVKEIQWEDWTEMRFLDRGTGDYQRAVFAMATELVRRAGIVERADVVAAVEAKASEDERDDDSPGSIERLAALEEAMPRWTETMNQLTVEMRAIGEIMTSGTDDVERGEAQGKGFAARLTVARRVAHQLEEPVGRIEELGKNFADYLAAVDAGIRVMIEQVSEQVAEGDEVEEEIDYLFTTVRALALTTYNSRESIEGMIRSAEPLERQSKDMRKPLRILRRSLAPMAEAAEIAAEWTALMDQAGLGDPLAAAALAERDDADADAGHARTPETVDGNGKTESSVAEGAAEGDEGA